LVLFVRIWAFQRVTTNPNKKLSSLLLAAEHPARRQLRHGEPNHASPPECLDGAPLPQPTLGLRVFPILGINVPLILVWCNKLSTDATSYELTGDEPFALPPDDSPVGQGRGRTADSGPTDRPNRRCSPITAGERDSNALFDHLRQRDGPLFGDVANDQMAASVARPPGERQIAAPL
jgi:hypothetical protein